MMNNCLTAEEVKVLMEVFACNDDILIDDFSDIKSAGFSEFTLEDSNSQTSYKFGTELS